jgi:signal transduction histidine kinase/CheY-like chemotaxis protein
MNPTDLIPGEGEKADRSVISIDAAGSSVEQSALDPAPSSSEHAVDAARGLSLVLMDAIPEPATDSEAPGPAAPRSDPSSTRRSRLPAFLAHPARLIATVLAMVSGTAAAVVLLRLFPHLEQGATEVDAAPIAGEIILLNLSVVLFATAVTWLWGRPKASSGSASGAERRESEPPHATFDHAFDPIFTFGPDARIQWSNRAARELFQQGAPLIGEPVQRFVRLGFPTEVDPTLLGNVIRSEAMLADGAIIPVELSLGRAGDGDASIYTAVIRDISERVDIEDRIRVSAQKLEVANRRLEEANAQLEEASKLKSEFLANTSHELRTPLNGMIGFLQLVLDKMCESPEEEREFLKQALDCSRHLLGLINDVLDIAKIEAGKLSMDIDRVDVRTLFGEVYTLTHVQAAQRGLKLNFETPETCDDYVRGDFGKIKQVLVNLVGNSIKFTPHGAITVRAVERTDLGHWLFEVVDTGIGIAADRHRLIFEKFTQGDGSTTRRFGGTGLGLAISRSLVELMGGIIGVESAGEGHGTRMYFSLPVWRDDEKEIDEDLNERIEGPAGGPLVLLVEDDPVFRKFLSTLLQRHGYRTVETQNAETGWLLARRLRPAAVVLDYALSCADSARLRTGWDLAERMAADEVTRHIPLVFVTGFDGQLKDKLKATAFSRAPDHLLKPVDSDVLVRKIEKLVGASFTGTIRILLADDDPTVAAYMRKVLPAPRFHLEVVNNGDECLHALRTQPNGFDVLLLDLMMPDVSGYDVLRDLALSESTTTPAVLVLTNYPEARNEEERRLLERGLVLDVIAKPTVHDNPALLPHIIEWHLQAARERGDLPSFPAVDSVDQERKAA